MTSEQQIKRTFLDNMIATLGTADQVLSFQPRALYPNLKDMSHLDSPFTEYEEERSIRQLAKNKTSSPDGVPNEFLQEYWHEIKEDIMGMVNAFYSHELDLKQMNRAHIVMI